MTWQLQASLVIAKRGITCRAVTSVATDKYNCIAWAMSDQTQWWWPNGKGFWPGRTKTQSLQPTLENFHIAFATRGFVPCVGPAFEPGFEKVALYAKSGEITHAARQLPTGFWTSKLGPFVDVEHDLAQIEGLDYGNVVAFMRRPIP